MSTPTQVILAAIEAAGGVCEIACPGCKLLVDVGEELAKLALAPQTTEAEQVADAEKTILDADAAAVGTLQAAHVNLKTSPIVAGVATVVGAGLAAAADAPKAQPPGTVAKW